MVSAFQESNKSFLSPEVRTLVLTSSDQFLLNTASVRLLLLSGPLKAMIESAGHNWDTAKKDYATSDKIRNQLNSLGIVMKDEKDGSVSWDVN